MAFPSPTVLPGVAPYFRGTTAVVLWVPTIASPAAPTSAEITAGKNISALISAIAGFAESTAEVTVTRLGTAFEGSTPGRTTASGCSIDFLAAAAGPSSTSDVRSFLTPQTLGNICFANEGFTTGMSFDVWPVRVGAYSPTQDTEANAMIQVPFFPWTAPSLNIAIPTV